MRTRTFRRIGKHHVNNCEDSAGVYPVGSRRELVIVCDGCSVGEQSNYVSELIHKLVREIAREGLAPTDDIAVGKIELGTNG